MSPRNVAKGQMWTDGAHGGSADGGSQNNAFNFRSGLCRAGGRASNIAPLQFGFSYRDDTIVPPALLAAPTCRFGPLTTHQSSDTNLRWIKVVARLARL